MLFKKGKPFPMMETTVRLCKFIGLWHDTDLGKVCWQAKFTLASLTFWYLVPEICFVTRQDRELTTRLKGMIEILAMSIFVVRIGAHVLHRGTLQRCFWDVQETLGQFVDSGHVEVQKMLEHLVSSASFITRSYTTALLCNASLYGDIPALIAIGQYLMGADIETFPPTILEADYVLFEHQSNIFVWLPQSSAISEAIYQCGWTERTPSEQKLLMFVQMRSQRRVAITVWKFFALGRASFSVAIKTTFQYFTIMRQLCEIEV
ncbi:hypothetical protein quinque_013130 [Culex quinquefasciatus]